MSAVARALLALAARRRRAELATQDVGACQSRLLLDLVGRAKETRFGRAHGFASIRTVADFQSRVPLRDYDAMWRHCWEKAFPRLEGVSWPAPIRFFALSSGTTTGVTKYLPVSDAMIRANQAAARDILVFHHASRPATRVMDGRIFMLGGSVAMRDLAPGIRAGDLSGIAQATAPWWIAGHRFPTGELAAIGDWEEKIARLGPASRSADIRAVTGLPSWLLRFVERQGVDRLVKLWPRLELVIHGGVGFAPYRARFKALLEGSRAETREVFPASEGFFAIADRGDGEGMRLLVDRGVFFELVPVEDLAAVQPRRLTVDQAETEVDYALAVTTCAGLWAYLVGDVVRFVQARPPRVIVAGRTAWSLSAFGEHLVQAEIEAALAEAGAALGVTVSDYCVAATVPQRPGERGRHRWLVELEGPTPEPAALAAALDGALARRNADYAKHRAFSAGIDQPLVEVLPRGGFERWMAVRGKLGGQHKVPRVVADPATLDAIRQAALG
jgi:hypothetical protein